METWMVIDEAYLWTEHRQPIDPAVRAALNVAVPDACSPVEDLQQAFIGLCLTATFEGRRDDGLRDLFAWVDAHVRTRQDMLLHRLAEDLGIPEPLARRQFDSVQRALEDAGVGDGYGRLTIRQPVRPPVQAPTR